MIDIDLHEIISHQHRMLIDGELCEAADSETLDTINPANAEVIKCFPDAADEDLDRAVRAAQYAQTEWSSLSLDTRQQYLGKVSEILRTHSAELGALD